MRMMEDADRLGATTVLLQGGLNPAIPWEFYPDDRARGAPALSRHHAALLLGARDPSDGGGERALDPRRARGASTRPASARCPGGGAEILATRVRKRISVKKGGPEAWLDVHRAAHRVGMRSTATMMYGHVETDAELIEHLELRPRAPGRDARLHRVRAVVLQARQHADGGEGEARGRAPRATCACSRRRGSTSTTSTTSRRRGSARARRPARSRSTSAPTTSAGTLFEENVHLATGHVNKTTVAEIETLIREAGFTPAQRTTLYEIVRVAPGPEALGTARRRRAGIRREPARAAGRVSRAARGRGAQADRAESGRAEHASVAPCSPARPGGRPRF